MSQTQEATQGGPGSAWIEGHDITGPRGDKEIDGANERARRWYHPRPKPRRRTDLMGFSSMLWMAVGWIIVIFAVLFPFPWWGW